MLGVINDHEAYGTALGEPPRVIPVVHDNFDSDERVVKEAFRRADGHLYILDPSERSWEGSPSEGLIAVLKAATEAAGVDLEIAVSNGTVSVGSSVDLQGSDSNNLLLAGIARLLSADLAEFPLVGVAYEAGSLDILREPLLWELLVSQAPSHLPGTIGTFVPIEAGPVDYMRHCGGEPSVRFAVVGDDARKRSLEAGYMDAKIQRSVPDLDHPLVLFLGAGVSASAHIPVGDAVRDAAIRRLLRTKAAEVAEEFRVWARENDRLLADEDGLTAEQFAARLTLERVLREEFKELDERGKGRADSETVLELQTACNAALEREPPGRKALRSILANHPRVVVVTINFDQQVEDGLTTEHRVYASQEEFAFAAQHVEDRCKGESESVPILKVHGTIDRPETLVADVDDTEMGLPQAVKDSLEAIFADASDPIQWMWIGCSMRDIDVTQWMRAKKSSDVFDLWIDGLPGKSINQFITTCRPEISESTAKHVVSELPDLFLPRLATHIEDLAGVAT
jgi:hypothetical protein